MSAADLVLLINRAREAVRDGDWSRVRTLLDGAVGLDHDADGHTQAARAAIERALAVSLQYANAPLEAECHRARAELCLAQHDSSGATVEIRRTIALFEQLGARSDAAEARAWAAARELTPNP